MIIGIKIKLVLLEPWRCSMLFTASILELHMESLSWQDRIVLLYFRGPASLWGSFPM